MERQGASTADAPAERGPRKRRRPEPTPAQRALGLLVRREHSRKELANKLAARGVGREEAEAAVERMAAEGWQDDARFAASVARWRAGAGYGPLRIRAELGSHGLDEALIVDALAGLAEAGEGDWPRRARELARRRFGEDFADDPARSRKAADFLLRRGFDGEAIRSAIRGGPDID
ncbi:regulatory protein RecX [Luteimonas mephitis]|uniref:regulatory protein RecX n=1 Tax=Luteimonas mephitis TaxID=83615 RepID=UPI003A94AE57